MNLFTPEKVNKLIDTKKSELEETLADAKIKFADACLDEDYSVKNDTHIMCKNIQAQITILDSIQPDLLSLFEPAQV